MCSQSGSCSLHSDSEFYFTQADNRIGGKYWKAQYVEYVDATFTQRKRLSEAEAHLGILGRVKPTNRFCLGKGRRFSRACTSAWHDSSFLAHIHVSVTSFILFSLLFLMFCRPSHQGRGGRHLVSDLCQQSWQSLQHSAPWLDLWQGLWCSPKHRWWVSV